ncbi:hypothetical protein ACIRVK_39210 [Streptomyces sp. NPDC101152]|uniref:hypothetical protein n=1 Tax=Streptomyces sp. NPDC101152 TaxID=3366116 RepID=UPI00380BC4C4
MGDDLSAVGIRCHAGCLLIEVRQEIGPAAEPRLGRLLHSAIRPGGTAVIVDIRQTTGLGAGGLGVVRLARALADRHGLAFACLGAALPLPALPGASSEPTDRHSVLPS